MYFTLENGNFVEDENGILCGIKGLDSNGNNFFAVFFMPQFTSLQYGKEVQWIYTVHIQPEGFDITTQIRNETVVVSNDTLIDIKTGEIVPPTEPQPPSKEGEEPTPKKQDPTVVGQLDYYVGSICKGLYDRVVVYEDMMEVMIQRELIKLPSVNFHK